jgi:hypothetical protein
MTDTSTNDRVPHPEIKLEDVRESTDGNNCQGRGGETASSRGYNAELLAHAVLGNSGIFLRASLDPWVDTVTRPVEEFWYKIEVKSCVDRYEKRNGEQGRYGSFKLWKSHHDQLVQTIEEDFNESIYFFVVYTVENGTEKEVGKLIAPVETVDDILDNWFVQDHVTMGPSKSRQISWRLLLKRLNVSRDQFESTDIVDLTET